MASVFAWVDFADEDRRKMAEVIDLFREQDTRDELGLGVIRDSLADLLFPGTSTIQTRARYFLFVPWIYRRHETRNTAGAEIARKARTDEIRLIEALVAGGEGDGVIGVEKRGDLQRLASSVYWAGLAAWRIRRFNGSQDQYHRAWDSLLRRSRSVRVDDDKDPIDGSVDLSWDPALPDAPADLLKQATLTLTNKEAEYLQHRILSLGPTLLGHLVTRTEPDRNSQFVWLHPEADGFPQPFREYVEHARFFSEAMHGAALLYNLMLSGERGDDALISEYRERFDSWAALISMRADAFQSWRRDAFWLLVERTRAHVGLPARRFVDEWLDLALSGQKPERLAETEEARLLIRERERMLKRGRARLGNPGALARWNGSAGAQQLNFRWHRVRAISADILDGLET